MRPSGADLARVPGKGDSFAAVYDDRLTATALRYAERRKGRWNVRVIASTIDGRPVGREPTLAISPHGLRLAVFRTDIDLDDGHTGNGTLYASRSPDGLRWFTEKIDSNGFGATPGFDAQGRPAIAYLARVDTTDAAEVRLAHLYDGSWHIETLAHTTYRQAASEANASSVGLALDRYLALKVAYIDPGSHSVRLVGEDAHPAALRHRPRSRPRARRCRSAPTARSASSAPAWQARTRGCGSRPAASAARRSTFPAMGQSVSSAVIAGFTQRRPDRRLPRPPRRLRGRPGKRRYHSSLIARAARYSASSPFNAAFGAARSSPGDIGVALVANGALLVFAETAF